MLAMEIRFVIMILYLVMGNSGVDKIFPGRLHSIKKEEKFRTKILGMSLFKRRLGNGSP